MALTPEQRARVATYGFVAPLGTDLVAGGDDAISDNALAAVQLHEQTALRVTDLERTRSDNSALAGRVTTLETDTDNLETRAANLETRATETDARARQNSTDIAALQNGKADKAELDALRAVRETNLVLTGDWVVAPQGFVLLRRTPQNVTCQLRISPSSAIVGQPRSASRVIGRIPAGFRPTSTTVKIDSARAGGLWQAFNQTANDTLSYFSTATGNHVANDVLVFEETHWFPADPMPN